jgi:hypothetical protein
VRRPTPTRALGILAVLTALGGGGCARDEPGPAEVLVVDPDPPLDMERSPYTGWTRDHHVALFARTLSGFVDHLSEGGARTTLSGSPLDTPGAIEGVTRMLQAMGYWLANPDNPSVIEYRGRELDVVEIAKTALLHGTDPEHEDYWLPIAAGNQRVIEAGFVGQFLLDSRERVWDTLTPEQRDQVMAWLTPVDDGYVDNWTTAELHRNLARAQLGYPIDEAAMQKQLDLVYELYTGDGWYHDGLDGRFDYYNSFIIHPDLLAWARHAGDSDPERAAEIRARAAAFAHHFPYFYDAGGAQVFFGRSLAYRTAATAGLQAAEIEGVSPLPDGQARRLVSGNLALFVGGDLEGSGAMFDADDAIRSGYFSDEAGLLEPYQREGSQYFFARGFAALRLSEDHPYWSATEQPIPADEGAFVHTMTGPGFVLSHDPDRDLVLMLTTIADKMAPDYFDKYRRVQYSSRSHFQRAFEAPFAYDGLVMASATEQFTFPRNEPLAGEVGPGFAYVRYTATPESDLWYEPHRLGVASLWIRGGILRVACLDAWFGEPTRAYEGGFAVDAATSTVDTLDWDEPALFVESPELSTLLAAVFGYEDAGMDLGSADTPRFNAIHDQGTHPTLRGRETNGTPTECTGSFQVLGQDGFDPDDYEHVIDHVDGAPDTRQRILTLDDGTIVWVNLDDVPTETEIDLGPLRFAGPIRVALSSQDGTHFMAVGASEITRLDDLSPVVEIDPQGRLQASAVAWSQDQSENALTVEMGAPGTLFLPPAYSGASVHRIDLGDERVPLANAPADGAYEVGAEPFAAATTDQHLELARFEFVVD